MSLTKETHMIMNPILRGFNPDPSICRVGEDYYIATSTFEWFPGVQLHHSRDLVHWRQLPHPLNRSSQLQLEGVMDSGGVWAPCLTYCDGLFYLIYTVVHSRKGAFKDTPNYLVTATSIEGPWSEPVYLNSSGFDPSLFHDDDGRKWLVNMLWDHRQGTNSFAGIVLQEYSVQERKLVGPVRNIFRGTNLKVTEGPHLYKRNGWYYLLTAEGGTQYGHAASMARARELAGPYEVDPANPFLTSAGDETLDLQKAGHASLVHTHTDEWYVAHLCGRPVQERYCNLGRETALQRCYWTEDGWLRLAGGGNRPQVQVEPPRMAPAPVEKEPARDDFDTLVLSHRFSTLRIPADPSWLSLAERPGYLRLRGMESMSSCHRQSMVAVRQQAFTCTVETAIEFEPEHFQQMAGLILYYDTEDYVYLRITHHEKQGKCLGIIESTGGVYREVLTEEIPLPSGSSTGLRAEIRNETIQFSYSGNGSTWLPVGGGHNILHLSDDFPSYIRFTGTFIGLCAQDLSGAAQHADFSYFEYREEE